MKSKSIVIFNIQFREGLGSQMVTFVACHTCLMTPNLQIMNYFNQYVFAIEINKILIKMMK